MITPRERFIAGINKVQGQNRAVMEFRRMVPSLLEKTEVKTKDVEFSKQSVQNNPRGSLRAEYSREITKWFETQDQLAKNKGRQYDTSKFYRTAQAMKLVEDHFDKVLRINKKNADIDKHSLINDFFSKTSRPTGYMYLAHCMERWGEADPKAEELVVDFLASKKVIVCGPYRSAKSGAFKGGSLNEHIQQQTDKPKGAQSRPVQANNTTPVQAPPSPEVATPQSQDNRQQDVSPSAANILPGSSLAAAPQQQEATKQGVRQQPTADMLSVAPLAATGRSDTDTMLFSGEVHPKRATSWPAENPLSIFVMAGGDPQNILEYMRNQEMNIWRK